MDNQQVDSPINSTIIPSPLEPGLTKKQKIGLYALVFLIFVILAVWFIEVRYYIASSMFGGFDPVALREEAINAQKLQENQDRLDATYNTDTDNDGLPDWEEMNIYSTSAFLADTDGDGIADKEEVDNKTNPICPEGKECIAGVSADQQPLDNSVSAVVPTAPNVGQDQLELLKKAFGDNPDTKFLRTQLLNATTNDQQKLVINGLSDQQLVDFYKEIIQGPSASSSASGQAN